MIENQHIRCENMIQRISPKLIVIDLDETIGYFIEMFIVWTLITEFFSYTKQEITITFENLLSLYPQCFRPRIFDIFMYLKYQKTIDSSIRIILYTNNININLVNSIISFIETRIKTKLFDLIIYAYKINHIVFERCRSCSIKTYEDLINCIGIEGNNINVCVIDNTLYNELIRPNVCYFHISPYIYMFKKDELIDQTKLLIQDDSRYKFIEFGNLFLKNSPYIFYENKFNINSDLSESVYISKKLLIFIRNFLGDHQRIINNKTKKNKTNRIVNKTFKNKS